MLEKPGDTGYGFKNLDKNGRTHPWRRDGSGVMQYELPADGEKWGPRMQHPNPAEPDGLGCGPSRYHVWRRLYAMYAGWPWFVQWRGLIGHDALQVGVRELRLRRIRPEVLHRGLRLGWGKRVRLNWTDLCEADLHGADLRAADLFHGNLRDADLRGAALCDADLSYTDLCGADLRSANLRGAKLYRADLDSAHLNDAKYDTGTIWPDDFDPEARGCIKV